MLLNEHTGMGRFGRVKDTRELIIPDSPYIVVYQVEPTRFVILDILHSARQWPEKF